MSRSPPPRGYFASSIPLILLGILLGLAGQTLFGAYFGPTRFGPSDVETADKRKTAECKMAIVGGGVGGLHFALQLLDNALFPAHSICIFERSNKFAGRANDYYWPDASGHAIGGDLEPVGLGGWRIDADNNPRVWKHAVERYNMTLRRWQVIGKFREARGVIAPSANIEALRKGYPVYQAKYGNLSVLGDILARFPATDEATERLRNYVDMYDLVLSEYGSEAAAYVRDVELGGWTSALHLVDPRWSLDMFRMWGGGAPQPRHYRPVGGGIGDVPRLMSEELKKKGVRMWLETPVSEVNECSSDVAAERKEKHCYHLHTAGHSIHTSHLAFAIPPLALAKISGSIPSKLGKNPLITQSFADPAFKAALLFSEAWWEPTLFANGTAGALDAASGSGNCLGQVVPYLGSGPNGEKAIHVSYISGDCVSLHWAHLIATLDEEGWKAHLVRQLGVLFPGIAIPKPLRAVVKLWDEGAWHQQRPTTPYRPALEILRASTEPMPKEPVYLINEAFGLRRGWMEASFESAEAVIRMRFLNMTSTWEENGVVDKEGVFVRDGIAVEAATVVSAGAPMDFTLPMPFAELVRPVSKAPELAVQS